MQRGKPDTIQDRSSLFIPVIDFDVLRNYKELLEGSGLILAQQQTRFRLDERGAVLKSEAVIAAGRVQDFVFDRPFLVLLQRSNAQNPYFALWVANAELLVPFRPRE